MTLLPENEKRKEQLIREYSKKVRAPGDYWWRKVEELQGYEGDYVYGEETPAPWA